jgi:hypothetical protein
MSVVRWVIVLLTFAVCGGAAAFPTIMLLKVVGLAEGYRYTAVAVVALVIFWSTAPKLIRWAKAPKSTPSTAKDRQVNRYDKRFSDAVLVVCCTAQGF